MYWEERFMSKLFPDTYEKYMQGIPRLLPYRFKKSFKTQAKFSWEQVTINREQSSAFWMILATTLIAARWFIF
jgi:hypothetical protein